MTIIKNCTISQKCLRHDNHTIKSNSCLQGNIWTNFVQHNSLMSNVTECHSLFGKFGISHSKFHAFVV